MMFFMVIWSQELMKHFQTKIPQIITKLQRRQTLLETPDLGRETRGARYHDIKLLKKPYPGYYGCNCNMFKMMKGILLQFPKFTGLLH